MREDRERWNRRYRRRPESEGISPLVAEFAGFAHAGIALDIAAGQGQNALFLARRGFRVEAVDIAEEALGRMAGRSPNLYPVCADLDLFDIPRQRYNLIVNIRFLGRRLLPQIFEGLRPEGVLIFEAFLEGGDADEETAHPEYRLQANELLSAFPRLRIVYYRETVVSGEAVQPLAALVGIKP